MCLAAAQGTLLITKPILALAKEWLLELETNMPEIFRDMSKESDKDVMDEIKLAIVRMTLRTPVFPERKLVQILTTKIPTHRISYFIDTLLNAGYIEETEAPKGSINALGQRGFRHFKAGVDLNKPM